MIGDTQDMLARIKSVLPARWFSDTTPILDALLTGLASAWSRLFTLLLYVRSQSRIATANGIFLDIASADYLGGTLPRRIGELDAAYSNRIQKNLLAPKATRASIVQVLSNLTGRSPIIFEPLNASDTGGYNTNLGYNIAGGYGSMMLPYEFFLTAYRPNATPISNASGYNYGPGGYNSEPMFYIESAELTGGVSDAEIYAAIANTLPTNSVAWTQILN
jgi:hypothetical protein